MLSIALLSHFSFRAPLILVDGTFQSIVLIIPLAPTTQLSHSQTHLPIINKAYTLLIFYL